MKVGKRLGASAVNAGAIMPATRETIWVRSNMPSEWLAEYTEKRLFEVDPIVYGLRNQKVPELHAAGEPMPGMPADTRQEELRFRLLHYGYAWFWAHLWREEAQEKIVVMATDRDPRDMFGPDTLVLIRTASALMAARLTPPAESKAQFGLVEAYKPLSPRERDVLAYLAEGLDNNRMAERMGLAEVTVRMHLRNARKKMGAETREQALALAILRGALKL